MMLPFRAAHLAVAAPRVLPPNPLYVRPDTGSDGNVGDIDHPLATLTAAQALCAGLPDWTIRVLAPATSVRQAVNFETSMDLVIEGVDDQPWLLFGADQIPGSGWTGPGPVYSRTLGWSAVGSVVVTTLTETIGPATFQLKLVPNTATPTTPAAGEFGYSGGVLYIRLPDDADPVGHVFEASRRNTGLTTKGFGRLTIRDCDARHFIVAAFQNGLTGQPDGTGHLTIEDSTITYSGGSGVGMVGQWEDTRCLRVVSRRAANDGFNVHATAGLNPVLTLDACEGSYNGDKAGQSAQGASNHEDTVMVINGGRYDWNVSGGMVVIDRARSDLHGDTTHGPVAMDRNMRLGNTAGIVATQGGCAWMDTSQGTVTGPVSVTNGQGRGVVVTAGATVVGAASIVSTGNAAGNYAGV